MAIFNHFINPSTRPSHTHTILDTHEPYDESQKVLEEKQKMLKSMFPEWAEVLVIKEQYNVS